MPTEDIILEGHIIDSRILPRVMDAIMDLGGDFEVIDIQVGRRKAETSRAQLRITAPDTESLDQILSLIQPLGARVLNNQDAHTEPAPRDGALPDDFYSTTNLETLVRLKGQWTPVANTEMDLAIVVDWEHGTAQMRPMSDV